MRDYSRRELLLKGTARGSRGVPPARTGARAAARHRPGGDNGLEP